MPKKTLPKMLFAKIESDGSDNQYIVADDSPDFLVEMGDTVKIGKYQLVEVSNAKGVAQIERIGKRR